MSRELAVLVFRDTQRGLQNKSFNYRAWAGLSMIKDVLERAGHNVGACDARDASGKIVLASITSQDAWYDLVSSWVKAKPRDAILICGGAGVLNVRPIIPIDKGAVFVLGRGEDIILPLIESVMSGDVYEHESVIYAEHFDINKTYKVCTGRSLYPHPVALFGGQVWTEAAAGCRYQCLFCNYTWCRSVLQESGEYGQQMERGKTVIAGATNMGEHNLRDLVTSIKSGRNVWREGFVNSAIDGQSQRIRDAIKKPVSRDDLVFFGENAPQKQISLMTVVGFPTETKQDRAEAINDLWKGTLKRRCTSRWAIEVSPNAFRPMPGTPLALWPAQIKNWRSDLLREWGGGIDGHKYRIRSNSTDRGLKMHWGVGGPVTQIIDLVIHRGTESDFDSIAKISTSRRFWSASSARRTATLEKYFDVSTAAGEHKPETYPVRYLEGRIPNVKAWKMGDNALSRLRKSGVADA